MSLDCCCSVPMKTNSGLCPQSHPQWWLVVCLTLGLIFDIAIRIFSVDTVIFGNATNIHLVFLKSVSSMWIWEITLCKTYCWMIVSRYFAVIRSFDFLTIWLVSFMTKPSWILSKYYTTTSKIKYSQLCHYFRFLTVIFSLLTVIFSLLTVIFSLLPPWKPYTARLSAPKKRKKRKKRKAVFTWKTALCPR